MKEGISYNSKNANGPLNEQAIRRGNEGVWLPLKKRAKMLF